MEQSIRLELIHSPQDLKALPESELTSLCEEIRHLLMGTVAQNGGHLASNLGAVELTVALHRVFDLPEDQIVWDVGHQSYTHKILTGRASRFYTLRQEDGISGFPRSSESEYDAFIGGHAGNSVSAALGIAVANSRKGNGNTAIAVVGDGAFTNGMIYEALNNAGRSGQKIVVVLNDNGMSISKNVGAFTKYLSSIRSSSPYFHFKDGVETVLRHVPLVGDSLVQAASHSKSVVKHLFYNSTIFEDLGFTYFGPVDGHDLTALIQVLQRAKGINDPVVVHVQTIKGKGYILAEKNPGAYHGVSSFDTEVGNPDTPSDDSFSCVMGKHLCQLAKQDDRICAITAAMKYGTGLHHFSNEWKNKGRFFDVGIAEGHGMTFAAGLASRGLVPVYAVYSTFAQRIYDQVIHDASIEKRHVVLALDRAGIVGDDGETHQGLFDVAMLSNVPDMVIYSPSNYRELCQCLDEAIYHHESLCAVRYPRGSEPSIPDSYLPENTEYGFFGPENASKLLVTYGQLYSNAVQVAQRFQKAGEPIALLKLTQICPISQECVEQMARFPEIYVVEEGIQHGGLGEHLASRLLLAGYQGKYHLRAVDNQFVPQAKVKNALKKLGMDVDSIEQWLRCQ